VHKHLIIVRVHAPLRANRKPWRGPHSGGKEVALALREGRKTKNWSRADGLMVPQQVNRELHVPDRQEPPWQTRS
jgi:hypothetical protein